MKFILTFLFTLLISAQLLAQTATLPIPRNMQPAYENQTRSLDGLPGKNYWTNHADYSINVALDPATRRINGKAVITYYNQSPDTLSEIILRLYPNIFIKGAIRDWPVNPVDLNDGVTINHLSLNTVIQDLNGVEEIWSTRGTNGTIHLPNPLPPSSELVIGINWQFILPDVTPFRMGKYDSTSFFVAYWYPQVAVYDDIDGWDRYNYGGLQEFYNDANNYDIKISVPANFTVWATGVLRNPKELFPDEIYKRYQAALKSDTTIHIMDSTEVLLKEFTINPDAKQWHFTAENVPDFAFSTSDHYLWDMNSLVVDSSSNRRVTIQAAYKKESPDFYEVASISRASINFYSNELPGVPFPYPELTVFNGGGGMEFPMMVNDGSASKRSSTVHVTSHEIAHTYFPFYMGTNERKYAFMDEGWAVMMPYEIQNRIEPSYDPIARSIGRYESVAGMEMDIPMSVSSIVYNANAYRPAYRNAAYTRPAMAYLMLQNILGKEQFKKGMQEYILRWHQKHPIPNDFFFTFDQVAGEDLSWFWKPWFLEFGYPDLGIKEMRETNSGTEIIIENNGSMPIPVFLEIETDAGAKVVLEKSATIWKDGKQTIVLSYEEKNIKSIHLGNAHIPDANPDNDHWTSE